MDSASRATTSPDLDVHSIFNSSASSSLKTKSLNKFEEFAAKPGRGAYPGDSYISSPVISIDSDIIPDTKTWTSGSVNHCPSKKTVQTLKESSSLSMPISSSSDVKL